MNIICLPLLMSLFSIGSFHSIAFCDVFSYDMVFNVGHLIHMFRCGEVWTYDPRLNGDFNNTSQKWTQRGKKGKSFIKDYSWYAFARRHFADDIAAKFGKYDNKYLRFAAFSFQEIWCTGANRDIEKDCYESAKSWSGLSVIIDNYTAVTFRYKRDFDSRDDSLNPLNFPLKQEMGKSERHFFWPDFSLGQNETIIYSALYSNSQNRLYIVLLYTLKSSKADHNLIHNYYCFTHINMREMLFDEEKWPKTLLSRLSGRDGDDMVSLRKIFNEKWAPLHCISGSVVGMFEEDEEVYAVGRILDRTGNNQFDDQLYTVEASDGKAVNFQPTYESELVNGDRVPRTLRSYFGCPMEALVTPEIHTSLHGVNDRKRKKRSPQKSGHTSDFSYKESLIKELKEDWLQLSVMSFAALLLLSFIIRVSKNIYF